MNQKANKWGGLLSGLLLSAMLLGACSDDEVALPSRVIKQIDIWETGSVQSNLLSTLKLVYDQRGMLKQISGDKASGEPLMDVNYTYPDDCSFLFTYAADGGSLGRISGTLENGRAYACKFTDAASQTTYSYSKDGFMTRSDDGMQVMEFVWKDGNLASVKSTSRVYNMELRSTTLANNYSVDLTVLPHLLEDAAYRRAMNTYCWLAGVLGKKSNALVEDDTYRYTYRFDEKGRLNEIELAHLLSSTDRAYSFRFTYEE